MEWALLAIAIGILVVALASYGNTIARLGGIERKLNALLRHHGVDPTQGLPLSDRVKQLAADPARKIEAIKVYREETGAGVAEAKEAVEAFINSKSAVAPNQPLQPTPKMHDLLHSRVRQGLLSQDRGRGRAEVARPNHALQQTAAEILVSRSVKALSAAAAAELYRSPLRGWGTSVSRSDPGMIPAN